MRKELFLKYMAQTSSLPLMLDVGKADGIYIYDADNKPYLDLISGIGVSNIGHSNPLVIQAIKEQVDKYLHTMVYGEYVQTPQVVYAELLVKNLSDNLNSVYFTNSGTEAIEGSMKLAKKVTQRTKFISLENAYHGSTQGALSITGADEYSDAFRPLLPNTFRIRPNSFTDLSFIDNQTAGVFIEILQAESGCKVLEDTYLLALTKKCKETGSLLIIDECQTGFGRCGTLFLYQQYNISPDILVLGKAIGGGLPLGAFISDRKMMIELSRNPHLGHITTFGGHPLSCASGFVSTNIVRELVNEGEIELKSKHFIETLQATIPITIYGKGLLLAIEIGSFEKVQSLIKYLYDKQILSDWFLYNATCIRIAPPLIISYDELTRVANEIADWMIKNK